VALVTALPENPRIVRGSSMPISLVEIPRARGKRD